MKRNQSVSCLIRALGAYLDADRVFNIAYHGDDTPAEIEEFLRICVYDRLQELDRRIGEVMQEFEI